MNWKQKTVLWIAAILIIGQLAERLQVALQFGAWDFFLSRTVRMLPFYFFVVIIAGILIYAFKDKKQLIINCPRCGHSLKRAAQEIIGDTVVCPRCKAEFVI